MASGSGEVSSGEPLSLVHVYVRSGNLALVVSSGLAPLIATVKPANPRQRDDFRRRGRPRRDDPSVWGVFVQSEVAAICVIVGQIRSDKPKKMALAEDDDMFE